MTERERVERERLLAEMRAKLERLPLPLLSFFERVLVRILAEDAGQDAEPGPVGMGRGK